VPVHEHGLKLGHIVSIPPGNQPQNPLFFIIYINNRAMRR
jgi:hypothetical protein